LDTSSRVIESTTDNLSPKVSIIAYDGGFRERFFQVDSLAKQTVDPYEFEYIWVESFSEASRGLLNKLHEYPELNYKVIALNRSSSYFLSKCVNEGIKSANGEIVIVLDADTYVQSNAIEVVIEEYERDSNFLLGIHRWDEPSPPRLRNKKVTLPKLEQRCELLNDSNYGGFFALSKVNYLKSGGYEEHSVFSGYDSAGALDLKTRFTNMGLEWVWHPSLKTYHICHENSFSDDRWSGFRVESQWRMISRRELSGETKPILGIEGRYRELGEWWEDWLSGWDSETVSYERS